MPKNKPFYKFISLESVLVLLVLAPIIGLNISGYHDWGGDFAQYIQQAINIVSGKTQNDTFYVFNPHNPYLGPPAYPVGFSLLLAPVYAIFGNSLLAFKFLIGFIIWISAFLLFKILKEYFHVLVALLATIFFVFNPWVIQFKAEVVADFPFLLFVLLAFYLYIKKDLGQFSVLRIIFLGATIAFSMLIKSVGIVVFIAILTDLLWNYVRHKKGKTKLIVLRVGLLLGTITLFYFVATVFVFPTKQDSYSFFATLFVVDKFWETMSHNASYYIEVFQSFYHPTNDNFNFLSQIIKAGLLTFCLLGFFVKATFKPNILVFYSAIYFCVILVFPNSTQGIRYLLPILPAALYFILIGFRQLSALKSGQKITLGTLLILALSYQNFSGYKYTKSLPQIVDGPQHPTSKELFDFIKSNTSANAHFVFIKPRVLGLYVQRYSFANSPKGNLALTETELNTIGYNYICLAKEIENAPLEEFVAVNQENLILIFENEKFKLFEKK